jgi:pimeloyl-ACP methyl ester carboxylesterase
MIESTRIAVNGVSSEVYTAGQQGGDVAVVFVHGNPGASEDWHGVLPQVGAFARAIAADMPGYGKADRPRDFDYTVAGYAAHLEGLLQAQGIRRVHLVLHDFGGAWGLYWASQHAERVQSISLVNVGVLPGYRWHTLARIWRTPVIGELFQLMTTRQGLRQVLNSKNPKPFPQEFIDRIHANADWGHKRAVLKLYRATSDLDTLATEAATRLKPRSLPALVLWGEGDGYLPVSYAEVQKEFFQAQVHRLPGCGHWPMIDDPEGFAGLLVPFLLEQWARSGASL